MYRVLLVGDDAGRLDATAGMLGGHEADEFGFDVRCATPADALADHLRAGEADVVLADLAAAPLEHDAVARLVSAAGDRPVVILSPDGDAAAAPAAVACGAQDVLAAGRADAASLAAALQLAAQRQRQLNDHLATSREYQANLRTLVECSGEAILVVDGDGLVRLANPAAARLFGRDAGELLDQPYDHPMPLGGADEIDVVRADGTTAIAITRAAEVTWHGRDALLVTLRDATALRKKERRLRQAINMEAIGRLTAGVAHDFNNKLTIITGFARLATAQLESGHPLEETIGEIARAASQSAKLVNQLLSFGRKQLRPKTVDLSALLESMKPSLARLIGPEVRVVYDLAADLGSVRVDPTQMEEAVTNLATNARDAMPAGGELRITASNADLSPSYASQNLDASAGPHVLLRVTDTGTGMDERTAEQIFEPFFTTKPSGKGTGIGLAMVYAFTVQSGGHVVVDSRPGEGTSLEVYLPRSAAPAELDEPAAPADLAGKGEGTVLVVEDEQPVRKLLCRVLAAGGYNVIEAADGFEALRQSETHDGKIDLLLTDVVMPGMNGPLLAGHLARTRPDMTVLYISGYTGGVADRDELAAEGAVLLAKPFSPDDLLDAVTQRLDKAKV